MCACVYCVDLYFTVTYAHLPTTSASDVHIHIHIHPYPIPAQTVQLHEPYDVLFDKYKSKTLNLNKSKKMIK